MSDPTDSTWRLPRRAAGLLALAAAVPARAQPAPPPPPAPAWDAAGFQRFVDETLAAYAVPGAVVAVAGPEGAIAVSGHGLRRAGEPGRVDADTRFQLASVSKMVAATAVGRLVDRGLVAWDVPVSRYAPATVLAVPYATENATLRDYFAHRTGLPAYGGDLLTQLGFDSQELVRRARFLDFDHSFREKFAYSNYGIFLGQQAAAGVAGLSPPALLAELLQAVGMARSGPGHATLAGDGNAAAAHGLDGQPMPSENVDAFSGAGAVVSTGADMARWVAMLLAEGRSGDAVVLKPGTVADLFAASMVQGPGGPLHDPNDAAGLGCESYDFLGTRVIEKNGALDGVRTIVTLVPGKRIGIAVLCNKHLTVFPEAVRAEFLERVIGRSGRDLQAQVRAEAPLWAALSDPPKLPPNPAPLARPLQDFAGHYESRLFGEMALRVDGPGLAAAIGPAAYPGRLRHWSGEAFLLSFDDPDQSPNLLTFTSGAGGITGCDGTAVPGTFSSAFGRFDRRGA